MAPNRPVGRQKNNIGKSGSVSKRGSGLKTGPVGNTSGKMPHVSAGSSQSMSGTSHKVGKKSRLFPIIAIIVVVFIVFKFFGSSSSNISSLENNVDNTDQSQSATNVQNTINSFVYSSNSCGNVNTDSVSLNESVSPNARDKYVKLKGNGQDSITIMVYMCGTDLESRSGMATSDLQEMTRAKFSDNINLIVYTGGCKKWQNGVVSSDRNQIYKIQNGGLIKLEDNMGSEAMVKGDNLASFIKYCNVSFPADRNELIFWDHGGGSISGYGYDEKNPGAGSMKLSDIDKALQKAGVKFDFIGFDACLMATLENALMLDKHADYLIASEETEPGVGWYYTNWLESLSNNTSMPTIEIGKNIIDDFVDVCNEKCYGQKTTLSVVDLSELSQTVPEAFKQFSVSTNELINNEENDGYRLVAHARNLTREFAQSSHIDQIDVVDFANNIGSEDALKLSEAVLECVKYNRTAKCMTNAYGLSIYFPYKKTEKVKQIAEMYDAIGIDEDYTRCIKDFAAIENVGQEYQGGNQASSLSMLGSLLGSNMLSSVSGAGVGVNASDISEGASSDAMSNAASNEYLDAAKFTWQKNASGENVLKLSEKEWGLITKADLCVFVDDGQGYIDLGRDNIYEWDNDNNLVGASVNSWLSLDGQFVPYYHLDTVGDENNYTITGYIPAFLNGQRVRLIVVFDSENPQGYIAGANTDYHDNETETVAKNLIELKVGDELDFICDYYSYDGKYNDSYLIGDTLKVNKQVEIGDMNFDDTVKALGMYSITDIYQQEHFTDMIP